MDPGMHVITHTTRLSAFMTKYLTFVRQQRERGRVIINLQVHFIEFAGRLHPLLAC